MYWATASLAVLSWCDLLLAVGCCCCQDPEDKRYANCNETLEKLTGQKRILMFGAQKFFKDHFKK